MTNTKSKTNVSKATTMADLLKTAKPFFVVPHKGDIVGGVITKLTKSEILVDINAKTESIVLEKDKKILNKILSNFKVGDRIQVTVLNPESDEGNPVVSLRRSIENAVWEKLESFKKNQENLDMNVDSITKGGFLVTTRDGISGFLPNSHVSTIDNPQKLVGKKIKAVVLELNRPLNKIIFSMRHVLGIKDFEKLIKDFKIGRKIEVLISSIAPFGIFVLVPTLSGKEVEGMIHVSEISWSEETLDTANAFSAGQKITAAIMGFDKEARRINLSIKRLTKDPFEEKVKDFPVDKKLKVKVVRTTSKEIICDLGDGVVGVIKKEKIPPNVFYREGEEIEVVVSSIDEKRHKVVLSPVLLDKPIGYR